VKTFLLTLPLLSLPFVPFLVAEEKKPQVETAAGWIKYEKGPVLGGDLGTCFDVSLLHEGKGYREPFAAPAAAAGRGLHEPGANRASPRAGRALARQDGAGRVGRRAAVGP
jgi:hypothetical protein